MGIMTQKDTAQTEDEDVGTIRPWKKSMRETVEDAVGGFFGGDYWANKTAKNLTGLADFVPVVGDAAGAMDTVDSIDRGDYLGASIDGFATLLGVTPVVGPAVSKGVKSLKKPLRDSLGAKPNSMGTNPDRNVANVESEKVLDKAKVGVENYSKILEDHGLKEWDGVGSRADTFSFKNDKLEVYTGYSQEVDGKITRGYDTNVLSPNTTVKSIKRILGYDVGPAPKIAFERGDIGINQALMGGDFLKQYGKDVISRMDTLASKATVYAQKDKLLRPVKDGTKVGVRLNLNSKVPDSPQGLDKLQTLHKNNFNGEVLSFQPYATVENVVFSVKPEGRQSISAKILGVDVPEAKGKYNAMSVDGNLAQSKNVVIKGGRGVREIGFNPKMHHLFVDMETGQAVKGADVATVIGDRVYARGVKYWKKSEAPAPWDASDGTPLPSEVRYKFNQGGLVEEMNALNFNTGGLSTGSSWLQGLMAEDKKRSNKYERGDWGNHSEMEPYKRGDWAAAQANDSATKVVSKMMEENDSKQLPRSIINTETVKEPWQDTLVEGASSVLSSGVDIFRDIRDTVSGGYDSAIDVIKDINIDYEENKLEREMNELRDYELESIYTPTMPTETEDEIITNAVHKSIRREENGGRKGWDNFFNPDRWMPHKSVEGGLPTIGYGHKFSSKKEMDDVIKKGGWTEQEALNYFKKDMIIAEKKAKANYEEEYKDREWSSLTTLDKLMLTEIVFNIGDLLSKKKPNIGEYNWPLLTGALHEKDYETALNQLSRTYTNESGKVVPLIKRVKALKKTYRNLIDNPSQMATGGGEDKTDYDNLIG